MRFLCLLMLLFPMSAWAEALPELFSVTNVQKGDMLNIRVQPDAKSEIMGRLDPQARNIEVVAVSPNGGWALINAGEGSGWVSKRFLKAEPSVWQNGKLPQTLRCFGTEPFWSADFSPHQITLRSPDAADQSYSIQSVSDRGFAGDRIRSVQAEALTAVIFPQQCSDGMSDRAFGLQAIFSLKNGPRPMLAGCCSIAP